MSAILHERSQWDPDLLEMRNIDNLDDTSDMTQYVTGSMSPHPHRDYVVYRAWRYRPSGKCELFVTSTRHSKVRASLSLFHFYVPPACPWTSVNNVPSYKCHHIMTALLAFKHNVNQLILGTANRRRSRSDPSFAVDYRAAGKRQKLSHSYNSF